MKFKNFINEKSQKFKVGDIVTAATTELGFNGRTPKGLKGVIKEIDRGGYVIGVLFDNGMDGHDLNGKIPGSTRGWYVGPEQIKLYKQSKNIRRMNWGEKS